MKRSTNLTLILSFTLLTFAMTAAVMVVWESVIRGPFSTTRRESGGTGLGLSISFGIIHDYGGTIRAEGEPGEFARFIVELPADDGPEGEGDGT